MDEILPELAPALKRIPTITYNRWTRPLGAMLVKVITPKPVVGVDIEEITLLNTRPGFRLRLRVYRPTEQTGPLPALLWIHGGGYIMGTPKMDDFRASTFARDLGIVVISPDYGLAPKHAFPAPLFDLAATWRLIQTSADRLQINPERSAIGGESAGAGLAAALAQHIYDDPDLADPVGQVLIYPMLDDRTATREDLRDREYKVWNFNSNVYGWSSYLSHEPGRPEVAEYSVPARRENLSGLAPTWIGVGTLDLFYDEDVEYAERLRQAGVTVTSEVVPGAYHGFAAAAPEAPVSVDFHESQVRFLRRQLFE